MSGVAELLFSCFNPLGMCWGPFKPHGLQGNDPREVKNGPASL